VVSHTHWDREWYHGAARFRQRLVALVDAVLAHPGPGPFLLDGQAIVLRDYLAVRDDQREALGKALRSGRLEAGPWYVLADNLIPSGEAIIRNLEAGRRVVSRLGATAPQVAYCPDTFGHPAALPLIAEGFGLGVGIVWRGAGCPGHPARDAFWWRAANGSRLLTHHLPPDGYEFGSAIPEEFGALRARWHTLRDLFDARTKTGTALLLNGADHHARQRHLERALERLQAVAGDGVRIVPSSLQHWADEFLTRASTLTLPTVEGELRSSYGYTWTLGGTLATRAHQKRRNARLERGLLRDVEPWIALARLHDRTGARAQVNADARLTLAQLPALLHRAWEDLLETHPHDTLCGCSTDAVARAMEARQESVAEQGRGLREAALQLVLGHDPAVARDRRPHDTPSRIVLRNRTARRRGGLAHITLREWMRDVPVGPGSAAAAPSRPRTAHPLPTLGEWPLQRVALPHATHLRRESPQHYPDNDVVVAHRVLAWVPEVPALGMWAGDAAPVPAPSPPAPVRVHVEEHTGAQVAHLDNGVVHVAVEAQGRVTIGSGDRLLYRALEVITAGDEGDSYTPKPLVSFAFEPVKVEVREHGPLRGAIAITWRAPELDAHDPDEAPVRVTTTLRLSAGSPVVECDVRGWNQRTNHRVRIVWHTDVEQGRVTADAALGPVRREPIVAPPDSAERVPDGQPMHRWLTVANADHGATLIGDGMAEAHVAGDTIALTVLRAVGELSKPNLATRPGHAGWPVPAPAAQCLGAFCARCALLLHGPLTNAVLGEIRDACDDILLPLVGETWIDLEHATVAVVPGVALEGDAFEASAVTVSQEDSDAVVLRAINLTNARATGLWQLPDAGPWIAEPVRLDETPVGPPVPCEQALRFDADPHAVLTWRVRRAPPAPAR
jgi:alpha-mannosidase